ncbi:MAG TPA: hypothetical protein VJN65_03295 [Bacteroidota bacterium]|nr:hypothetical protein [Bacteroidota bacterium]
MKQIVLITAVIAAFVGGALSGCSSAVQLTSAWNDHAIIIDGSAADWGTSLMPVTGLPLALGVRNDGEFLYVCLSTQDPFVQAQILNGGLTVWFDPRGENEETFGIRFPLRGESPPHWNPREPLTAAFQFLEPSFRELAILGPDDQQNLFSVLELKGIGVKLGALDNTLVYELRVPLRHSAEMRYAVGIIENQMVGIGFQTAEFGSDRLEGPSGRAGATTRGGGRRRGGGGTAGGGPIGGADRPEPLDLWTKVVLSSSRQ